MDYTREVFIDLLEKHFGEVKHDGRYRYYVEGYDNKEIADILDYSEKQFGSCLNGTTSSYQTVIRRLLALDKVKGLEKRVGELEAENKILEASQGRRKFVLYSAIGIALIAMILTMWNFYWLPARLNDTLAGYVESQPQRFVVRDVATLEKIMQWHGKIITNQLALEAVLLNSRVKAAGSELTPEQKIIFMEEAKRIVKNVIKDERIGLNSLGFVTTEGKNIEEILEKVAPYDSLFQASDPLFTTAFQGSISYILSQNEPYKIVSQQMIDVVKGVQGKTWGAMKNQMFNSSQ